MARPHRSSLTAAVIVCLVSTQLSSTIFASDDAASKTPTSPRFTLAPGFFDANPPGPVASLRGTFEFVPDQPTAFARQIYQGRPYPIRRNHDGSIAALMIGAAATITGTAILLYANRPDCDMNRYASACGYGTKVVGGSVLAGGMVGLFVGAITW